jgi:hypothetical protein
MWFFQKKKYKIKKNMNSENYYLYHKEKKTLKKSCAYKLLKVKIKKKI